MEAGFTKFPTSLQSLRLKSTVCLASWVTSAVLVGSFRKRLHERVISKNNIYTKLSEI